MHTTEHPLAGCHVRLRGANVPKTPVTVDDWYDRVEGDEDANKDVLVSRLALECLWDEDEDHVVVGHLGSVPVLCHDGELGQLDYYEPLQGIETDTEGDSCRIAR